MENSRKAVYEISINLLVGWQAHSLSNAGSGNSNRLFSRSQLLADGTETDAISGNGAKHHHAALLAEYLQAAGVKLCPACAVRDSRRAAALVGRPGYEDMRVEKILLNCALCDIHGFLITAKNSAKDGSLDARERLSKHTLIEFSDALALPDRHAESLHIATRTGTSKETGQMLMKMPSRSGEYTRCVRYKCVGVGLDTERWKAGVTDYKERLNRHVATLSALRDYILSPDGAQTATKLPLITKLCGVVMLKTTVGSAPIYAAFDPEFINRLLKMCDANYEGYAFNSVDEFYQIMNQLIAGTEPFMPAFVD